MAEEKLFFDDVNEGDEAPVVSHVLTRTDLVMYAGASGDFNPMHHDEVAAQASGLPSVFGHGMFSAGLLATAVTDYVGIGNLSSYRVRFTKHRQRRRVEDAEMLDEETAAGCDQGLKGKAPQLGVRNDVQDGLS